MDIQSHRSELKSTTDTFSNQPGTYTEVIQEDASAASTRSANASPTSANTLRLRLTKKPSKNDRRVSWTNDTIDNEFMNKKKSKCCCVYSKPRNFDESSSEDENEDTECTHCKGHRKTDFNSLRQKGEKMADEPDDEMSRNGTTESGGSGGCHGGEDGSSYTSTRGMHSGSTL